MYTVIHTFAAGDKFFRKGTTFSKSEIGKAEQAAVDFALKNGHAIAVKEEKSAPAAGAAAAPSAPAANPDAPAGAGNTVAPPADLDEEGETWYANINGVGETLAKKLANLGVDSEEKLALRINEKEIQDALGNSLGRVKNHFEAAPAAGAAAAPSA